MLDSTLLISPLCKSAVVVEHHDREERGPYMRTNKTRVFRTPQKETWFSLMITLLGVALMVVSFVEV